MFMLGISNSLTRRPLTLLRVINIQSMEWIRFVSEIPLPSYGFQLGRIFILSRCFLLEIRDLGNNKTFQIIEEHFKLNTVYEEVMKRFTFVKD